VTGLSQLQGQTDRLTSAHASAAGDRDLEASPLRYQWSIAHDALLTGGIQTVLLPAKRPPPVIVPPPPPIVLLVCDRGITDLVRPPRWCAWYILDAWLRVVLHWSLSHHRQHRMMLIMSLPAQVAVCRSCCCRGGSVIQLQVHAGWRVAARQQPLPDPPRLKPHHLTSSNISPKSNLLADGGNPAGGLPQCSTSG